MSVTVTPPPAGDRGNGQDSRKAVDVDETGRTLILLFFFFLWSMNKEDESSKCLVFSVFSAVG